MAYDSNNIFAKIIRKEIPCRAVYEDDFCLAFHDLHPAAPVHVLVIPKCEAESFHDFIIKANQEFVVEFFKGVKQVAEMLDLEESGYRLITNHGADALQSVKHFHVHLLGKAKLGALVAGDLYHS